MARLSALFAALLLVTCLMISARRSFRVLADRGYHTPQLDEDEQQQRATIQRVSSSSNQETIKIGNTKTNNYNVNEHNYQPTQLTQVVLNVPKLNKKLRRTRPPTQEEYAIKQRILEVYRRAKQEAGTESVHLLHLGRILDSLNPKYIATERVQQVAFADPRNPELPAHFAELAKPEKPIHLEPRSDQALAGQLEAVGERFGRQVTWSHAFVEQLSNADESLLSPTQASFKRLILCLSHSGLCATPTPQAQPQHEAERSYFDHRADHIDQHDDDEPSDSDSVCDRLEDIYPRRCQQQYEDKHQQPRPNQSQRLSQRDIDYQDEDDLHEAPGYRNEAPGYRNEAPLHEQRRGVRPRPAPRYLASGRPPLPEATHRHRYTASTNPLTPRNFINKPQAYNQNQMTRPSLAF